MTALRLQFDLADVPSIAGRYQYEDDLRVQELGRLARHRGWYERDEFLETCEWKSPRIRARVATNSATEIKDATSEALRLRDPSAAIVPLRRLHGVDWAVASVILHLAHRDPFPILDYRALEALGVPRGRAVTDERWCEYVEMTRALATEAGVDPRTLDRALWQWSKEHDQSNTLPRLQTRRMTRGKKRAIPAIPSARRHTDADAVIVGCVSTKKPGPAPARDLYDSPLWRKRRAFAEATGKPWVIFSAHHGIIHPDTIIEWYDVALASRPAGERRRKGEQAVGQLEAIFGPLRNMTFEIHAGSAYADALAEPLRRHHAELINPLAGLSIGYQLQWYGIRD